MQPNPGLRPLLPGPSGPAAPWRGWSHPLPCPPPQAHHALLPGLSVEPEMPSTTKSLPTPTPLPSQDGQCRLARGCAQPLCAWHLPHQAGARL